MGSLEKYFFHQSIKFEICCSHANVLIINKDKKEIEHFDPHGTEIMDFKKSKTTMELSIFVINDAITRNPFS